MEFNEYAQKAQETAIYPDELPDYVTPEVIYTAMGLSDEAGEVLGKVKKAIRDECPEKLEEVRDELGDVAWYLVNLCSELNFQPERILKENLEKLSDRSSRNVIKGDGDYR